MEIVANYEVKSHLSVAEDDRVLGINHPHGLYRARIRNVRRRIFSTPFVLNVNLYYDAPDISCAREVGDDYLQDCLNMLALATGGSFEYYRIRRIVDAGRSGANATRSVLHWASSIEYKDPEPFLESATTESIEILLKFETPLPIRKAMRWYRLGINAIFPDDQFIYFWLALEIVAESQKSTEKVPDKCPHCRSPLYCTSCDRNPVHRPYPKQAIRTLIRYIDSNCDESIIDLLEKARNSLMHGNTLEEIEKTMPEPHAHIVDILGRLVWEALLNQFPSEIFDGTLMLGYPSTYIHYRASAVAHIETIIPLGADGELDLSFDGVKVELETPGPPQSARPRIISLSSDQFDQLRRVEYQDGEYQAICKRILGSVRKVDNQLRALVLSTDMEEITDSLQSGKAGILRSLFHEIIEGEKANSVEVE